MSASSRDIVLVAFLQAQNCSNYPASWRHPKSALDFSSAEYYRRIARVLEAGCFDLAFFDDRLAMPTTYGSSAVETVRHGIRAVKLDAATVLTVMGAATERLGLGATYSTTYYEPFHVARLFATLETMFGGRAAWNIVTSLNDAEAENFGRSEHLEHDRRYDRAEEFLEIVTGHWDAWAADALILDKVHGIFADPSKVQSLNYTGTYLRSNGTFTVPRSPQGRPVLMQAGQSGRGRAFAGRWADIVFVFNPTLEIAKRNYAEIKQAVAASGRDPHSVKVVPAVYVIPGETRARAEEEAALVESLALPVDGLALLSEVLNYDFATKPYDEPFEADELASISGLRGFVDKVVELSGNPRPSVRDFVEFTGRGTVREIPRFVGTGADIADEMQRWIAEEACDGFVVAATHVPGSYEDVVRYVVPELQRRGVFRREYTGSTLREHLGISIPQRTER